MFEEFLSYLSSRGFELGLMNPAYQGDLPEVLDFYHVANGAQEGLDFFLGEEFLSFERGKQLSQEEALPENLFAIFRHRGGSITMIDLKDGRLMVPEFGEPRVFSSLQEYLEDVADSLEAARYDMKAARWLYEGLDY